MDRMIDSIYIRGERIFEKSGTILHHFMILVDLLIDKEWEKYTFFISKIFSHLLTSWVNFLEEVLDFYQRLEKFLCFLLDKDFGWWGGSLYDPPSLNFNALGTGNVTLNVYVLACRAHRSNLTQFYLCSADSNNVPSNKSNTALWLVPTEACDLTGRS